MSRARVQIPASPPKTDAFCESRRRLFFVVSSIQRGEGKSCNPTRISGKTKPLDMVRSGRYNEYIKGRCDKRSAPLVQISKHRNRHLPEWRFLLFMINCNISFRNVRVIVSRIAPPPLGWCKPTACRFVQRPGASAEAPPTQ